jgi:hypothetical protein
VARTLALFGFALLGWGLCGATIAVARSLVPMETALIVHAAAAPVIAGVLAYVYARYLAVTTPLRVAAVFIGVVVVMDAALVAPFIERSWAMFQSPIGTWIPFTLIFLSAWGAAVWVMGAGPAWRWHATRQESKRDLPGDGQIPEARNPATHGITIEASREAVWPWLVQMGCERAGWYSWDRLDNGGRPSAERLVPELQATKVGEVLPARPGHPEGFEVLELEAPETFVLGTYFNYTKLAQLEWSEARPSRFLRATWVFVLEELGPARTRLLVRTRGLVRPIWLDLLMKAFFGPAHLIMQRKQLLNLKARAERI